MAITRINQKPNPSARAIALPLSTILAQKQGRSYLTYCRKKKAHRVNGPNPDADIWPKPAPILISRVNLALQIADQPLKSDSGSTTGECSEECSRVVKVTGSAVSTKDLGATVVGRPKLKLRIKIPKGFDMTPLKDCVVSPVHPEADKEDCIPFPDFEESMREYEAWREEEMEREMMDASEVDMRSRERGRKRRSGCLSEGADEVREEKEREGKRMRIRSF